MLQIIERHLRIPRCAAGHCAGSRDQGRALPRSLEALAENAKLPEEVQVAAVEALGSFRVTPNRVLDQLIASVKGKPSSNSVAEAAVRATSKLYDARDQMAELLTSRDYPLGLRREALRTLAELRDGGPRVLDLARTGKLPEDLKNEATTLLHTSHDRGVRDQADSVLPLPKTAAGRPLPSIFQLVRRSGDPDKGRAVFFRAGTNSCSNCHRIQGRGQWIGPDLSTIGVKYGREELIRSILSPSAAIAVSYRSLVASLADGRVITGLPVEDTPDRLVVKTADGQRIAVEPRSVEDRRTATSRSCPKAWPRR